MKKLKYFITHPNRIFVPLITHFGWWLPDEIYLRFLYRAKLGTSLNLLNPKTFTEKIQWLKLYDRRPEYTNMVDKYAVKKYVAKVIGDEYVIPTLGVWDRPEDIDYDSLPNSFVLKTTHSGGSKGVVICKNKSTFNRDYAFEVLKTSMKEDLYRMLREWPYKNVPKRIIAEEYLESKPNTINLIGYKWFCFEGEPQFCQVIQDRTIHKTMDFFDLEWNHFNFVRPNLATDNAGVIPVRPQNLNNQIHIARKLSNGLPFSSIDIYEVNEREYFGEITLYPESRFGKFGPDEYNTILKKVTGIQGVKQGWVAIKVLPDNCLSISLPDLNDYKFYCFDGIPKLLYITSNRHKEGGLCEDFFDEKGNFLAIQQQGEKNNSITPALPHQFEKMLDLASKLSKGIPHVRVDFYEINEHVFFGEMTFYCGSGFCPFTPKEWEERIGSWINLPPKY